MWWRLFPALLGALIFLYFWWYISDYHILSLPNDPSNIEQQVLSCGLILFGYLGSILGAFMPWCALRYQGYIPSYFFGFCGSFLYVDHSNPQLLSEMALMFLPFSNAAALFLYAVFGNLVLKSGPPLKGSG